MILQRHNRRHHVEGVQASFEAFDFAGNNRFGEFGFLAAVGDVAADGLLQVVDVVGEDAVELAHLGRNVAGHGNVDEKHRTVLAAREELLAVFAAKDRVGRARRSDDDVGAVARVIEILELDGLAVKPLRQSDRTIIGAVRHKDGGAAVGHQVAGSEFAHLAGADDEDRLPFQGSENLFGEFDCNRGDRY